MIIEICLPKSTGFDIEIDEDAIYSKYENFETTISLLKGDHTICTKDQAPAPAFWDKLINFFNPVTNSISDLSNEIAFRVKEDLNIVIRVKYEECGEVSFLFGDALSEFLE